AHLARSQMRGPDRQPRRTTLDQRKIDEIAQGLLQRSRRVEGGVVAPQRIVRAEKRQRIGREESENAPRARLTNRTSYRRAPANWTDPRTPCDASSARIPPTAPRDCGARCRQSGWR